MWTLFRVHDKNEDAVESEMGELTALCKNQVTSCH